MFPATPHFSRMIRQSVFVGQGFDSLTQRITNYIYPIAGSDGANCFAASDPAPGDHHLPYYICTQDKSTKSCIKEIRNVKTMIKLSTIDQTECQ